MATSFQVSYCENDVDCRRLLQLIHFGEKFDSFNCQKTCDNCSKNLSCVEKDVTEIAKQLVRIFLFIIYAMKFFLIGVFGSFIPRWVCVGNTIYLRLLTENCCVTCYIG